MTSLSTEQIILKSGSAGFTIRFVADESLVKKVMFQRFISIEVDCISNGSASINVTAPFGPFELFTLEQPELNALKRDPRLKSIQFYRNEKDRINIKLSENIFDNTDDKVVEFSFKYVDFNNFEMLLPKFFFYANKTISLASFNRTQKHIPVELGAQVEMLIEEYSEIDDNEIDYYLHKIKWLHSALYELINMQVTKTAMIEAKDFLAEINVAKQRLLARKTARKKRLPFDSIRKALLIKKLEAFITENHDGAIVSQLNSEALREATESLVKEKNPEIKKITDSMDENEALMNTSPVHDLVQKFVSMHTPPVLNIVRCKICNKYGSLIKSKNSNNSVAYQVQCRKCKRAENKSFYVNAVRAISVWNLKNDDNISYEDIEPLQLTDLSVKEAKEQVKTYITYSSWLSQYYSAAQKVFDHDRQVTIKKKKGMLSIFSAFCDHAKAVLNQIDTNSGS